MYIICKETDFFAERKRKSLSELFEKFFLEGKTFLSEREKTFENCKLVLDRCTRIYTHTHKHTRTHAHTHTQTHLKGLTKVTREADIQKQRIQKNVKAISVQLFHLFICYSKVFGLSFS